MGRIAIGVGLVLLALVEVAGAGIARGPWLQSVTDAQAVLIWEADREFDPAPQVTFGLSADGPGSTGLCKSRCPHGWSSVPGVPGAPNPADFICKGSKMRSRMRSSQD